MMATAALVATSTRLSSGGSRVACGGSARRISSEWPAGTTNSTPTTGLARSKASMLRGGNMVCAMRWSMMSPGVSNSACLKLLKHGMRMACVGVVQSNKKTRFGLVEALEPITTLTLSHTQPTRVFLVQLTLHLAEASTSACCKTSVCLLVAHAVGSSSLLPAWWFRAGASA
jgi:hypothetical protein